MQSTYLELERLGAQGDIITYNVSSPDLQGMLEWLCGDLQSSDCEVLSQSMKFLAAPVPIRADETQADSESLFLKHERLVRKRLK